VLQPMQHLNLQDHRLLPHLLLHYLVAVVVMVMVMVMCQLMGPLLVDLPLHHRHRHHHHQKQQQLQMQLHSHHLSPTPVISLRITCCALCVARVLPVQMLLRWCSCCVLLWQHNKELSSQGVSLCWLLTTPIALRRVIWTSSSLGERHQILVCMPTSVKMQPIGLCCSSETKQQDKPPITWCLWCVDGLEGACVLLLLLFLPHLHLLVLLLLPLVLSLWIPSPWKGILTHPSPCAGHLLAHSPILATFGTSPCPFARRWVASPSQ